MTLAERWKVQGRVRQLTFPTSIRLRPGVDVMLQDVLAAFPHLTQTQIINDLLEEGLNELFRSLPE